MIYLRRKLSLARSLFVRLLLMTFATIALVGSPAACTAKTSSPSPAQPRTPSDVVREFYKAMREQRFQEAFALTIYKPAVEGLNAEEMEILRPGFEEKAAQIPATVEIMGEQISGKIATVFVKIPVDVSSPQVTSQPLNLFNSGGSWLIGTEADADEVKKAGRRYFLDALITEHEGDVEDILKRLVLWQGVYSQQHGGQFGDFPALIKAGMLGANVIDPKLSGYNFRITVGKDGKSYVATAEPLSHGKTGKLSFWMDQTGLIKSADTGGKPLNP
ncbi:MAG TPA: hypothetical protein VJV21_03375 [Pyrinomonadaceae bacterium]|nr:hypothetical protein [Pyrinomonadaceae bacterium]